MRGTKRDSAPGISVAADWFGELPGAQLQAFRGYAKELETAYLMFSVSLDEAISLHEKAFLMDSSQVLIVASALCGRFVALVEDMLRSQAAHCRDYGTNPSIALLDPADFRSPRSCRVALRSLICHRALLVRESQFRNKIQSLTSLVRRSARDFCARVESFAPHGVITDSPELWEAMNAAHFDLNTCLRELMVMLKCFLRVLPDVELRSFQETVSSNNARHSGRPSTTVHVPAVRYSSRSY